MTISSWLWGRKIISNASIKATGIATKIFIITFTQDLNFSGDYLPLGKTKAIITPMIIFVKLTLAVSNNQIDSLNMKCPIMGKPSKIIGLKLDS